MTCMTCGASSADATCPQCVPRLAEAPWHSWLPRRRTPRWTGAVAAAIASVLVLGGGAGALWLTGADEDLAAVRPGTTPTLTSPDTVETSTPHPGPSDAESAIAAEQLGALRRESLSRLDTDGRWAVTLSAKQDGSVDVQRRTTSGSHVFHLPDILQLHSSLADDRAGIAEVYLVLAQDLGSAAGPDDDKVWMTIAAPRWLGSREDAKTWCANEFPRLEADEIDGVCRPQQLTSPRAGARS